MAGAKRAREGAAEEANKAPRVTEIKTPHKEAVLDSDTAFVAEKPVPDYHYCDACYHIRPVKLFDKPNEKGDIGECAQCQRDLAREEFRDATQEKFLCMNCFHWMHPNLFDNVPDHDAEPDSDEEEGYEDDDLVEPCGECSHCFENFTTIGARDTQHILEHDYDTAESDVESGDDEETIEAKREKRIEERVAVEEPYHRAFMRRGREQASAAV